MARGSFKRDKADELFSLWVRTRDNWTCQKCKRNYHSRKEANGALDASHFVGRGKENTRFEPLNVDTLCFGCHQHFTSNPREHYEWQVQRKGQDVVDKLRLAGHTYKKKDRTLERLYWRRRLKEDYGITA